jgi:hypothetical protein
VKFGGKCQLSEHCAEAVKRREAGETLATQVVGVDASMISPL